MYIINDIYTFEHIIKKSRFIGHLAPVKSVEEALAYLKQIRKTYYDATHNCYSYIVGDKAEIVKNSDDGEPSQTAGVVIYDVLQKHNLTNVICVITRYFGGIKLGAGGLIRAYGNTTTETVKLATKIPLQTFNKVMITCDYRYANEVSLAINKYQIFDKNFTDKVTYQLLIPETEVSDLYQSLVNITKNQLTFVRLDDEKSHSNE
jgi:uncharacterized YigZ family protein